MNRPALLSLGALIFCILLIGISVWMKSGLPDFLLLIGGSGCFIAVVAIGFFMCSEDSGS